MWKSPPCSVGKPSTTSGIPKRWTKRRSVTSTTTPRVYIPIPHQTIASCGCPVRPGWTPTPLIHIWGVHPGNTTSLKAAMLAEGLLPSAAIYDRIERYRNIVPRDQAAFDAHAVAVSSAARDTAWYTAQKNSYDLSVGTGAVTRVQQILDLHFPSGHQIPPPPDSMIYTEKFIGGGTALHPAPPPPREMALGSRTPSCRPTVS